MTTFVDTGPDWERDWQDEGGTFTGIVTELGDGRGDGVRAQLGGCGSTWTLAAGTLCRPLPFVWPDQTWRDPTTDAKRGNRIILPLSLGRGNICDDGTAVRLCPISPLKAKAESAMAGLLLLRRSRPSLPGLAVRAMSTAGDSLAVTTPGTSASTLVPPNRAPMAVRGAPEPENAHIHTHMHASPCAHVPAGHALSVWSFNLHPLSARATGGAITRGSRNTEVVNMSGLPEEHQARRVKIFQPAPRNTHFARPRAPQERKQWKLEYDKASSKAGKWKNPLMVRPPPSRP